MLLIERSGHFRRAEVGHGPDSAVMGREIFAGPSKNSKRRCFSRASSSPWSLSHVALVRHERLANFARSVQTPQSSTEKLDSKMNFAKHDLGAAGCRACIIPGGIGPHPGIQQTNA
jgi:hypothetical protein